MKRLRILFFSIFFLIILPMAGFATTYTFSDNFNDSGLDGWTSKIGNWSVDSSGVLSSSSSVYSVLWKDGSNGGGLYQSITVDAYFDSSSDFSYAHLRLRSSQSTSVWDTGYLAQFTQTGITIQDTHRSGNPVLNSLDFTSSLADGWNTLRFDVSGRGTSTNLRAWVNGSNYLDFTYDDANNNNDNGYIALGRLIKYDNASGYSSSSPVPEPATLILFGFGLLAIAGAGRKKLPSDHEKSSS